MMNLVSCSLYTAQDIYIYTQIAPDNTPTLQRENTTTNLKTATIIEKEPTQTQTIINGLCPTIINMSPPEPKFLSSLDKEYYIEQREADSIEYLNNYGVEPIINWFEKGNKYEQYYYLDINNDDVREIAFVIHGYIGGIFYIYGCQNGEYRILFHQRYESFDDPYRVEYIKDGNNNGYPEMTFWIGAATHGMHAYEMIEWDRGGLRTLLLTSDDEYFERGGTSNIVHVEATGFVYYKDINGDNVEEIVVDTGFPIWTSYESGLPFQNVIRYHKWNGKYYSYYRQYYGPPEYRFQAIQNGDRLSNTYEYEYAINSYKLAIWDNNLQWWTEERRLFLQNIWRNQEPTLLPPKIDIQEYPNLSAYAYYRLLLIYTMQKDIPKMNITLSSLKSKYHQYQTGYSYVELASLFWDKFQVTNDIKLSCEAAITYANDHPREILSYLGNGEHAVAYFGIQSIQYEPEDICPF